jgi:hypothetical protein
MALTEILSSVLIASFGAEGFCTPDPHYIINGRLSSFNTQLSGSTSPKLKKLSESDI